jgi:hypothetical protein
MNWLKHPAINLTEIARRLYGESDPKRLATHKSKLRKKVLGGYAGKGWQEWELIKLEELRKQILKELSE